MIRFFTSLLAITLLAAACSSGNAADASATPASSPATPAESAATGLAHTPAIAGPLGDAIASPPAAGAAPAKEPLRLRPISTHNGSWQFQTVARSGGVRASQLAQDLELGDRWQLFAWNTASQQWVAHSPTANPDATLPAGATVTYRGPQAPPTALATAGLGHPATTTLKQGWNIFTPDPAADGLTSGDFTRTPDGDSAVIFDSRLTDCGRRAGILIIYTFDQADSRSQNGFRIALPCHPELQRQTGIPAIETIDQNDALYVWFNSTTPAELAFRDGRYTLQPTTEACLAGIKYQLPEPYILDITGNVGLTSLPACLGQLTDLTNLVIQNNPGLVSLPDSICQLTNLTGLHISSVNGPAALPACLGQLINLTQLALISNAGLTTLPDSICQLTNLNRLQLGSNGSVTALPACLGQLTSLETLFIAHHHDLTALPDSICQLTNLTVLDIDDNPGLTALPACLGQLANLSELAIGRNAALTALPDSLGQLTNLTGLFIYDNASLTALPDSLSQLTNLTSLRIAWDSAVDIFAGFANCTGMLANITYLEIFNSGAGVTALPDCLGQLTDLTTLAIQNNPGLTSVPASICQLTNLTTLIIQVNDSLSSVPDCLGQLTNLEELLITANSALTSLPANLCQLTKPHNLQIGNNGPAAPVCGDDF